MNVSQRKECKKKIYNTITVCRYRAFIFFFYIKSDLSTNIAFFVGNSKKKYI